MNKPKMVNISVVYNNKCVKLQLIKIYSEADTAKPISLCDRYIIRLINGLTLQLKPQGNCIL